MVEILGSNFQLTPDPPSTGVVPAWNPTVEVLFDTTPSDRVDVITEGRLFAVVPISPLSGVEGAIDITVRNVDQDGNVITGEITTKVDAFTYSRPAVNVEMDLPRLIRQILRDFKRQVHENTCWAVSSDYTGAPSEFAITELAAIPAIVLSGPDMAENREYSINESRSISYAAGEYAELRPPFTTDLEFDVMVVGDNSIQTLNIVKEVHAFIHRNPFIRMLADPDVPDGEYVDYEMAWTGGRTTQKVSVANNSNIKAYSGAFIVRGFDIDDPRMVIRVNKTLEEIIPSDTIVSSSVVTLDRPEGAKPGSIGGGVVQYAESYLIGASPGE